MGSAVGKFFGEFGLDIDPFLKSVRTIESESKSIANSIKPLKNIAEDTGKALLGMGAAATGALAIMVKQAADYGDAIRDASIRTGIGTAAMGGLKIAAEQSGASFEDLQNGLKKLAVNADAAAKGSKDQEQSFKAMGIAVKDATTGAMRPMSDILGDVSEHFKKSTNATKESGEAVALFGKNGTQLIEFLELGKTGLQEFQEKAERLGLAIGTDVANQADKFNDTMNDLKASGTGLALTVGNILLPVLTNLAVSFTNIVVKVREFVDKHKEIVDAFAAIGLTLTGTGGLLLAFGGLLTIIPKVKAAWASLDLIMAANPIGAATVAIVGLTAGLIYFRSEVAGALVNSMALLVGGFGYLVEAAGKVAAAFGLDGIGKSLKMTGESIKEMAGDMIVMGSGLMDTAAAVDEITPMIEKFKEAHQKLRPDLTENASAMEAAAKTATKYREALADLYRKQVEDAAKFVKSWLEGFERTSEAADKYTESVQRSQVAASKLAPTMLDAMVRMQQAWDDANGKTFDGQVELFNKIEGLRKTDVDENVEILTKKVKDDEQALEKIARQHEQTIAQIKRSAGAIFDDMFLKGEGVFKSLQNMLKGGALSLGRVIFEDITGALLGPVLSAFRNFFNTTVKGIIDGALGGIGKSIGGAIAGLLGGGSGGLAGAGTIAAGIGTKSIIGQVGNGIGIGGAAAIGGHSALAAALGPAGSAGSIGLFGLSGAATLGIGAAIAGAALIAKHFIGEGRKTATKFTSGSQDQFDTDLGSTFNEFQNSRDAGTLTLDQANQLQSKLKALLSGITDDANQFATQGKNQKKVIDQFFEQQQKLFGKDWVNLTSQIDASIATLKSQAANVQTTSAVAAAAGPIAGIPGTGLAISASSIFAKAVDIFKGAVDAVKGDGGAAASGPISITMISSPTITIEGSQITATDVRDIVMPGILSDLAINMNGASERLIQIIKPRFAGVVTTGGAVA